MSISINKQENTPFANTVKGAAAGGVIGSAVAAGTILKPLATDSFKSSIAKQEGAIRSIKGDFAQSGLKTIEEFVNNKKELMKGISNYKAAYSTIKQLDIKYRNVAELTQKYLYGKLSPEELSNVPKDVREYVEGFAETLKPLVESGADRETVNGRIKEFAQSFREGKKASYEKLHNTVCEKGLKKALKGVDREGKILAKGDDAAPSVLSAIKDSAIAVSGKIKTTAGNFIKSENKLEYLTDPNRLQTLKKVGKGALIGTAVLAAAAAVKTLILKPKSKED